MTGDELVQLTIKQLSDNLANSIECFELSEDPEWPNSESIRTYTTIVWRFRVALEGQSYPDPNNAPRTVILSYSRLHKKLGCYIFFREVENPSKAIMADATIELTYKIPYFHKSYRKFLKLRKNLIKKLEEKDKLDFLKKLNSIFPAALDDNLFN